MFPIPFNFPFRKKDGSVTSIGAAIDAGGGSYELPTASANTKGGVKIGNRLTMTGEVLSADLQLPTHDIEDAGKVLTVGDDGSLEWDENGGAGVEILSKAEWDELTTAEKQAKGLIVIQVTDTGFLLGEYVNGAEYNPISLKQEYPNGGSISATLNDNVLTVTCTGVGSTGGVVVECDDPNVTHVTITPSTVVQLGTCTKSASLPTIITQGTGRQDWGSSAATYNFNPSTQCAFVGSTQTNLTYTCTFTFT